VRNFHLWSCCQSRNGNDAKFNRITFDQIVSTHIHVSIMSQLFSNISLSLSLSLIHIKNVPKYLQVDKLQAYTTAQLWFSTFFPWRIVNYDNQTLEKKVLFRQSPTHFSIQLKFKIYLRANLILRRVLRQKICKMNIRQKNVEIVLTSNSIVVIFS